MFQERRLGFAIALTFLPLARQAVPILDPDVRFVVTGVEESSRYLVYLYRIDNPTRSRGGVAEILLDLSAPPGTGQDSLPFTGTWSRTPGRSLDQVPFGAIAPDRWAMLVSHSGFLRWYAAEVSGVVNDISVGKSGDSVAPGASRDGFGVRSPFLPGIRKFGAEPTRQSCCSHPKANSAEHPSPDEFRVQGVTVAPTTRPEDMSVTKVRADLNQACGPLGWIGDGVVCGRLQTMLAAPADGAPASKRDETKASLRSFLNELEAHHGPGKPVSDNAYWLLKVNGEYLLAHP